MKIKNSNFYLSFTLVLILSVCFAVTPSQAGSAVASGSAGTSSATGQVYLHLSNESMPYTTGFGMVEIDVVGGDFQVVEGALWASYEDSLTHNEISVVAAGSADQVKIVLATGQIGEDPSTSDTFETIYIPSGDTESKQSEKGKDPHAEKRALRDMQARSGDPASDPISLTTEGQQDTSPENEENPSEKGEDPHAEKRALRDMQARSGDPASDPISLTTEGQQDTSPENEENPSEKSKDPHAEKRALRDKQVRTRKGEDPHAEKRALRDKQVRTGDEGQNADENPDDSEESSDESDGSEE